MTRHRLRLFLTLFAIAVSVGLSFTGFSMFTGIEKDLLQGVLKTSGHVVVATQEYLAKSRFEPLVYSLPWDNRLAALLQNIPGVEKVSPRIRFGLLLDNGDKNEPFPAVGVDFEIEYADLVSMVAAGAIPRGETRNILLGRDAAAQLNLKPGDRVTLVGKTAFNSLTAEEAGISAILDLGAPQLNKVVVMPLPRAQSFLEMEGRVSVAQIYLHDFLAAPRVAEQILVSGVLPQDCGVESWKERSLIAGIYAIFHGVKRILVGLIMLAAGIGILNIMLLTFMERRKEIGVLRALGCTRSLVFITLSCEVLLQGIVGAAAGILWSIPLVRWLSIHGINLTAEGTKALPIPVKTVIHAQADPAFALLAFGLGVIVSLVASLWPIFKAGLIEPVEAMR